MNISKTLFVFQTSRQLAKFLTQNTNKLLNVLTISELIDKIALVEDKIKISRSAQIAFLRRAVEKVDIHKLGFSKNFLDFLSNSDFLFSFFEELRAEKKSIDDIQSEDIYAAFEDHLEILKELFLAYKTELDSLGLYDFISVDNWSINTDYLQNFDEVRIESMGLFTAFELHILSEAAKTTQINLVFTIDRYNKKMAKKFATFGIDIKDEEGRLLIDLSSKKLISVEKRQLNNSQSSSYRLKNRVYEAPFAMSKIAEFLQKGYAPENIAVILPDEGFAPLLELFDRHANLNFAFGHPFSKTPIFAMFKALLSFASGEKNGQMLEAQNATSFIPVFLALCENEGVLPLKKAIFELLDSELWSAAKYEIQKDILKKELYELECEAAIFENMPSIEIGHILSSSLASKKIDDIGGGKIRVIGVLESRGIELDAAIVLDMNEEFFPKKLDKDLFLNTKIKERAGIPTSEDRQNLQKHFFLELMSNCKECVFAFVENDECSPSPFLYELGLAPIDVDEESLEALYFSKEQKAKEEPIQYDDTKNLYEQYKEARQRAKLSVSAFCDYLKCERLFYYRHIMTLQKEEIEEGEEIAKEIGSALHKALELAFDPSNQISFADALSLKEFVVERCVEANPFLEGRFEFLFTILQMEQFFENEIERQKSGYSVYAVEKPICAEIGGVLFDARVDRIDAKSDELFVIDYKSGAKEIKADSEKTALDSANYQLCLYTAMLQKEGLNIKSAYYYDLLRGNLVLETAMDTKLAALNTHVERFLSKPQFLAAKDKKSCRYCDFTALCGIVEVGMEAEDDGE